MIVIITRTRLIAVNYRYKFMNIIMKLTGVEMIATINKTRLIAVNLPETTTRNMEIIAN